MKKIIIYSFLVLPAFSFAQTTSEYTNTSTPLIPGSNNCGFGLGAYNGNPLATGQLNTATGYVSLYKNHSGSENTANGKESMFWNYKGSENVGIGYKSLFNNGCNGCFGGYQNTAVGSESMWGNTNGNGNTATGFTALRYNAGGNYNLAIGSHALFGSNYNNNYCSLTGHNNTAIGSGALYANFEGNANTAFGKEALKDNWFGSQNTAFGAETLKDQLISWSCNFAAVPNDNTALGSRALQFNFSGDGNVAVGARALQNNASGLYNTAIGAEALIQNTSGHWNVGIGYQAGYGNQGGSLNTSVGVYAAFNNSALGNTAVGSGAMGWKTTGDYNTAVGQISYQYAGTRDYNTMFGAKADMQADNQNSAAIGFDAQTPADDIIILGDVNTQWVVTQNLFNTVSDGRFKENLSETDVKGLEFIMKLRPVTYQLDTRKLYEHRTKNRHAVLPQLKNDALENAHSDYAKATAVRRCGLIAQEVEQAANECNFDFGGIFRPQNEVDNYSLNYDVIVVPLVKAVQEQQAQIVAAEKANKELVNEINRKTIFEQVLAINNLEKSSVVSKGGIAGNFYMEAVPNPFSDETRINYFIPLEVQNASLVLCDIAGKLIKKIQIDHKGESSALIDSDKLAPGIYFYSIVGDGKILGSKKLIFDSNK